MTTIRGLDTPPIFDWINEFPGRDRKQTAYQILLSTSLERALALDGDQWDTGKTPGENNYDIVYAGPPLRSRTAYYWRVRAWDEKDVPSPWSAPRCLETGVLHPSEWRARWIRSGDPLYRPLHVEIDNAQWIWLDPRDYGETRYFRASFRVDANRAIEKVYLAYTTYSADVHLNGPRLSRIPDAPNLWKLGMADDITDRVHPGRNVLAVKAFNREVDYAGFLAKVEIRYADGTVDTAVTNGDWKACRSECDGWSLPDLDDSGWEAPDRVLPYGAAPWGRDARVPERVENRESSAPMVRRTFHLDQPPEEARVYVTGLGLYDFTVNGEHPDDTVLNPAHTQYDQTVFYQVYDVTALLRPGANALAAELGKSFYNETVYNWNWQNGVWRDNPQFFLELRLRFADGREELITTDESWKGYTDGPTLFNAIYYGEEYDARREVPGWRLPDFDDSAWPPARLSTPPTGALRFQNMEPIRRTEAFPLAITRLNEATYILTAPFMTAGWCRLTFRAPAGTRIRIAYGETLDGDGRLSHIGPDIWWDKGPCQEDRYICKGGGDETFEPRFSYKGYQYIQVTGYTGELRPEDAVGYAVHNDVDSLSTFETGHPLIDRLHENIRRTMLNNFHGKPTDTPVWEKNGWTGDANVTLETFAYNLDVSRFLPKFIGDMRDSQAPDGSIPQIAPTAHWGLESYPVWNSVYIHAIERMRHHFGQLSLVREHYPAMKRLAQRYIEDIRENGWVWWDWQILSDWALPAGGTDPDVVYRVNAPEGCGICGSGFIYVALRAMERLAPEAGAPEDVPLYREAADRIRAAFHQTFYRPDKQVYETAYWEPNDPRDRYRQTSNLVALAFGLAPDECRAPVTARLVRHIEEKDCHLDTGIVGTKLILPVLSETDNGELAFRLLTQTTYPSWGYWVEQGATTTWEMYERTTRSRNHYFLGTYDEWLYSYLAGVRDVEDGYRLVTIRPEVYDGLPHVHCKIRTPRGQLESSWDRCAGGIRYTLVIPVGTTAAVALPAPSSEAVRGEDGRPLPDTFDGGRRNGWRDGRLELTLGSGRYLFEITE